MKRKSLSFSQYLFFSVIAIYCVFVASFLYYQYHREKTHKVELLNSTLTMFNVDLYDHMADTAFSVKDYVARYRTRHHLQKLRVTLVDRHGKVIFDNDISSEHVKDNHLDREEIREALAAGSGYSIKRTSETLGEEFFYSANYFPEKELFVRSALPYDTDLIAMLNADKGYLWDEIYSNPRMLGGFIWDWVDQGIYKILPDGRRMVAYGGDFGDRPNLKAFCFNGVVMSDRETTPKYWEVKKVYAPVKLEMEKDLQVFPKEQDVLPKGLRVTNRNHHIGLEGYRCLWTLIENGKKMKQGELALPSVAPGETGTMALPDVKINKQADVRLNVSIVLKEDALWAKAGHEILKEQFALNDHLMAVADGVQPGKRKSKFSVLDLWEDSYFQAFRAPTDNDKSFGNWLAKDWKNQGLDAPQVEVITPETKTQETDGTVSKKSVVEYRYAKGSIRVSSHYKIYVDGTVDLEQTYLPQGELPELPRLGSAFVLGEEYENLSWYGRGPWENYPDRKIL